MPGKRNNQDFEVKLCDWEILSLRDALSSIPDRRSEMKPLCPLAVVVAILVYSTLCGFTRPTGAESYCRTHVSYFMALFGLRRTPSFPTFSKVINKLDISEIAAVLSPWVETCSPGILEKYEKLRAIRLREEEERVTIEKIELELCEREINILSDALVVVPGHRMTRGVRYPLIFLIVMLVYSSLCGYAESKEMEEYCRAHAACFIEKFILIRTPSHDAFKRMKALVNLMNIAVALKDWIETCSPDTRERFQNLLILHIDGKAIRAASNKEAAESNPPATS